MLPKSLEQLMLHCYIVYTVIELAPIRKCVMLSVTWN